MESRDAKSLPNYTSNTKTSIIIKTLIRWNIINKKCYITRQSGIMIRSRHPLTMATQIISLIHLIRLFNSVIGVYSSLLAMIYKDSLLIKMQMRLSLTLVITLKALPNLKKRRSLAQIFRAEKEEGLCFNSAPEGSTLVNLSSMILNIQWA